MKAEEVLIRTRVEVKELFSTTKMSVHPTNLDVRKVGAVGTVIGGVQSQDRRKINIEVCFVRHDGTREVGAYFFKELVKSEKKKIGRPQHLKDRGIRADIWAAKQIMDGNRKYIIARFG